MESTIKCNSWCQNSERVLKHYVHFIVCCIMCVHVCSVSILFACCTAEKQPFAWHCFPWWIGKKQPIFGSPYLGNALRNLVEIKNRGTDSGRNHHSKNRLVLCSTKLCMRKNCIIVLSVNILTRTHRCGAPASWAAWHTTVSWYKSVVNVLYIAYQCS